jgi:hypothetical protein
VARLRGVPPIFVFKNNTLLTVFNTNKPLKTSDLKIFKILRQY